MNTTVCNTDSLVRRRTISFNHPTVEDLSPFSEVDALVELLHDGIGVPLKPPAGPEESSAGSRCRHIDDGVQRCDNNRVRAHMVG